MSDKKPNILLIEADQMAAFVLSMYRPGAQAITPNLDKLAANGVVFEMPVQTHHYAAPREPPSSLADFLLRTKYGVTVLNSDRKYQP